MLMDTAIILSKIKFLPIINKILQQVFKFIFSYYPNRFKKELTF